eukprot:3629650-Amphidinium_carterae.1
MMSMVRTTWTDNGDDQLCHPMCRVQVSSHATRRAFHKLHPVAVAVVQRNIGLHLQSNRFRRCIGNDFIIRNTVMTIWRRCPNQQEDRVVWLLWICMR